MNAKAPFRAKSLNWDVASEGAVGHAPLLNPRDIVQVAFLLEEGEAVEEVGDEKKRHSHHSSSGENRFVLGQLNVQWRSSMGDKGSISTGYLTGRKK